MQPSRKENPDPSPSQTAAVAQKQTKASHLFIVGLVRTGSNLTRSILNNTTPDAGLAAETHYLRHWFGYRGFQREFASVGPLTTDADVERMTDYVYSVRDSYIRSGNFWANWIQKEVPREEFYERLLRSDRSEHAVLDVAMELFAKDRPIRGEKTPSHLFSVPTLLDWYPQSKVLHTFRDPRAVIVSYKRWILSQDGVAIWYRILRKSERLLELFLAFHTILHWRRAVRLHRSLQQMYPDRYLLSKHEDLVADPATQLKKICDFIGTDYSDEMLATTYTNTTLGNHATTSGIDKKTAVRWRKVLRPMTNRLIVLGTRKHLAEFGYEA